MEGSTDEKNHAAALSREERSQYVLSNGLEIPEKTWWKDPGLRKLYVMLPILFLGNFDGCIRRGSLLTVL